MKPNSRWFPGSLQERSAWFRTFASNFGVVAPTLGMAAEVTAVNADADMMQFLADASKVVEAYADAARQFRIVVSEGKKGDPTPNFPAGISPSPAASVPTGMYERLNELVRRIRSAPSYTEDIGALLGILPAPAVGASERGAMQPDAKPAISVGGAFTNYRFTVRLARRGADAFKVQIRRMETEEWSDAAFGTASPIAIDVIPSSPGKPERVQVRAVLMRRNEPVGQPSDPTYVTVNP